MRIPSPGPRSTVLPALAVASACSLFAASALAGDVRGTLTVPTDFPSMVTAPAEADAARLRYWEEWNGFLEPRPARVETAREIAVVLTGSGSASTGEQPALRMHNGSLFPSTVIVRVGVATPIRNDDACAYEIFADGNPELGPVQTAPGNARPITVSAPGHWPLRDRNLPHVQGHLHALPDLVARAFVEPTGGYVFRGVEPGTYNVHVFQGEHEVGPAQAVTVGDAHEVVVAPITLARP
ncbi:MAG: hypothetical protein K1X94_32535 [Sandaracinaceae bacterium]|jgi:hypothetical protein|nr:hypothetical protein [Sandaracinaceae bacterium]